ncbi:MAG TPA: hypothetical protein VLF43_02660 [Candidatus Saccharimonadales bacterium]|nr:hypothetical protein [Candidatus Saccharimonadales bacterium]
MNAYSGQSGDPKPETSGAEVARRQPDQTLVESIGARLVGQQVTREIATGKKVGERFADAVSGVISDVETEALRNVQGRELFKTGIVTTDDGRQFGVAVARSLYHNDRFAIEPAAGPQLDMSRTVYSELRLASGQPDRVVRMTLDPRTGQDAPQDRDTFPVGPLEMGHMEQIIESTTWGATELREATDPQGRNSVYDVQQSLVPNHPQIES